MKTKIIINKLFKFNKRWKIRKAKRVVNLMNKVLNSENFKREILDYEFTDRRYRQSRSDQFREIIDNNEIYDILMKGYEQNSSEGNDYTWKLNIKLGRFLRQVGRREGNLIITQNWFFKKNNNDYKVAAHWIHEYSHVLGFHHDYEKTERRKDSIPYALGTIVEKVLEDLNQ